MFYFHLVVSAAMEKSQYFKDGENPVKIPKVIFKTFFSTN